MPPPEPATRPLRPLALAALRPTGLVLGGPLGLATYAARGRVSPDYFISVLGWQDVQKIPRASLAQRLFEGLLFGFAFSLVCTLATGWITAASCPNGLASRYRRAVAGAALLCWVMGGLAPLGLASLSPEFYRLAFLGVPEESGPLLRYAWVGGSIWGLQLGGLASVLVALVALRARWRRADLG